MSFDTKFNRCEKTLKDGHARFIARCPVKGCKEIKAADVPLKTEERRRYLPMSYPADQRASYDGRYTVQTPERGLLPHRRIVRATATQWAGRGLKERCPNPDDAIRVA